MTEEDLLKQSSLAHAPDGASARSPVHLLVVRRMRAKRFISDSR